MVSQQGLIDFNGLNGASFDTAALPPTHDIRPSRVTAFYGRVSREAVEPFDRTQGRLFGTIGTAYRFSRDHTSARVEKRIRKILTGTSVPLDTCLLMGDPEPATTLQSNGNSSGLSERPSRTSFLGVGNLIPRIHRFSSSAFGPCARALVELR